MGMVMTGTSAIGLAPGTRTHHLAHGATAAATGRLDAKMVEDLGQPIGAAGLGVADILVGNRMADADVQRLASLFRKDTLPTSSGQWRNQSGCLTIHLLTAYQILRMIINIDFVLPA